MVKTLLVFVKREGLTYCHHIHARPVYCLRSTGGVVASSANGSIVCSNTLDERLRIAYTQTLPDIRTALFGAVQRA